MADQKKETTEATSVAQDINPEEVKVEEAKVAKKAVKKNKKLPKWFMDVQVQKRVEIK